MLAESPAEERYVLRLYVTGMTPRSTRGVRRHQGHLRGAPAGTLRPGSDRHLPASRTGEGRADHRRAHAGQETAGAPAAVDRRPVRQGARAAGPGSAAQIADELKHRRMTDRRACKRRIEELRRRLEEAEETIRAIQQRAVDAFVVEEAGGAPDLHAGGCRPSVPPARRANAARGGDAEATARSSTATCRLAELLDVPHERLIGAALHDFVAPADRAGLQRSATARAQSIRPWRSAAATNGLRVGAGVPDVQRAAGRLRSGNRRACHRPDDARGITSN